MVNGNTPEPSIGEEFQIYNRFNPSDFCPDDLVGNPDLLEFA